MRIRGLEVVVFAMLVLTSASGFESCYDPGTSWRTVPSSFCVAYGDCWSPGAP